MKDILLEVRTLVANSTPQGDGYETILTSDVEYLEFLCWLHDRQFPMSESAKCSYREQIKDATK